jgi:hypothetical protein
MATFPIDLGVLVAVTTTSSRLVREESFPRCAKLAALINKNEM